MNNIPEISLKTNPGYDMKNNLKFYVRLLTGRNREKSLWYSKCCLLNCGSPGIPWKNSMRCDPGSWQSNNLFDGSRNMLRRELQNSIRNISNGIVRNLGLREHPKAENGYADELRLYW